MTVPLAAPTRLAPAEAAAVRAAVDSVLHGTMWVGGVPVAFGALGLRSGDGVLVADDEGGYAATAAAQLGHHATVLAEDRASRDALRARLDEAGLLTAVHYPWLVSEMPGLSVVGGPSPVAAGRRDRVLTLPCFPELTDAEVDRVVEALA